jgi:5-methylcytosine-specific restriction endonuclease McrA
VDYRLDPESLRFQQEVDDLVRQWARGDEREYWRRWKQLGGWSINKTQGDVVKKAALKKRLMEETGGQCKDCRKTFEAAALQMHRLDVGVAHDRARNFGYTEANVVLLCAGCHERREAARR